MRRTKLPPGFEVWPQQGPAQPAVTALVPLPQPRDAAPRRGAHPAPAFSIPTLPHLSLAAALHEHPAAVRVVAPALADAAAARVPCRPQHRGAQSSLQGVLHAGSCWGDSRAGMELRARGKAGREGAGKRQLGRRKGV